MAAIYLVPAVQSVGAKPQCSVLEPLRYPTRDGETEAEKALEIEYLVTAAPGLENHKLLAIAKDWQDLGR